jgi:hypothetical protein
MKKAERSLIIRNMESLGTPQMQRNGVTLIPTSHGLTTQGAYGLLWAQMAWTHSVTRAQHIAPRLSCCRCTTFHPGYARNRNIWCWQYWSSGPKQPGDRIDVYLRPLVDDLKILWKPSVPEVWDEYRYEEFTMHGMLFTTINDNPAHRNLSSQSKRKGAACTYYLEDTCAIWLRHSKKYIFMGHCCFLSKKHPYRAMDYQFNGGKGQSRGVVACDWRSSPLESQRHQNYRGVTQTD